MPPLRVVVTLVVGIGIVLSIMIAWLLFVLPAYWD